MAKSKRNARSNRTAARRVIERPPVPRGWLSDDALEIDRRRWRGESEIVGVEPIDAPTSHFGRFRVRSTAGGAYEVELRSLDQRLNSCGCADFAVNGLGSCKHIEGALATLRRRGARRFAAAARTGSPRVEIFLSRAGENAPAIHWPESPTTTVALRKSLNAFLTRDGALRDRTPATIEALLVAVATAAPELRAMVAISPHLEAWLADMRRRAARESARASFLAEVESGQATFDVLSLKLLPYQRDGMLHLAFAERALLADEMGLGKTAQAIAACELLRRRRGIRRVLVVCPASLKGEWHDQIQRFLGASTLLVHGGRAARLAAYAAPEFFTVVNYEQVVVDFADINRLVAPDVIVLDEAQRIKNWQTKTARAVKSLVSPCAFVLTGTPIENRIDEIYSIVQYLDPGLLGPLFRFNRDFYELDERGRPLHPKNLAELSRRLQPVLLRRRKRDVEDELPARTVKNFFVPMADEQRRRYDEYKTPAARLIHLAQRRPLTPKEFERLQRLLACMRMISDTPYILDADCRISPKLEELERLLPDLLAEPGRKVILFSEWERMLQLVREMAEEMGLDFAWHTGSVPQQKRRLEIDRFKRDPDCRLLLSTDSGSVGLNLQVASAVVNLDLPWNPAKLEQRIARAWRKNQRRTVDVINLVTEDSIEHNILHLLDRKQAIAASVLDGGEAPDNLGGTSGRRALVERMAAMIGTRAPGEAAAGTPVTPTEMPAAPSAGPPPAPEIPDDEMTHAIDTVPSTPVAQSERTSRGAALLGDAERQLRMAMLLARGGFGEEALPILTRCLELTAAGRAALTEEAPATAAPSPVVSTPPTIGELANSLQHLIAELQGVAIRP